MSWNLLRHCSSQPRPSEMCGLHGWRPLRVGVLRRHLPNGQRYLERVILHPWLTYNVHLDRCADRDNNFSLLALSLYYRTTRDHSHASPPVGSDLRGVKGGMMTLYSETFSVFPRRRRLNALRYAPDLARAPRSRFKERTLKINLSRTHIKRHYKSPGTNK